MARDAALLAPRLIPGPLAPENRGALDWGCQSLVAYGNHASVVIVDARELSVLRCLDGHKRAVRCVQWSAEPLCADLARKPFVLKLASCDVDGQIVVWNVLEASPIFVIASGAPVVQLLWHAAEPGLFFALEETGRLVLYSAVSGRLVWQVDLPEPMCQVCMNPFDSSAMLLVAANTPWVYAVSDVRVAAPPVRIERKYKVGSRAGMAESAAAAAASPSRASLLRRKFGRGDNSSSSTNPLSPATGAPGSPGGGGLSGPGTGDMGDGSVLVSVVFSPFASGMLYFVMEQEIVLFDTELEATVSSLPLDSVRPPFRSIMLAREVPHALLAVHEDGTVAAYVLAANYSYKVAGVSDVLRIVRGRVPRGSPAATSFGLAAIACAPGSLGWFVGLTSDGRLWRWQFDAPADAAGGVWKKRRADAGSGVASILRVTGELACLSAAAQALAVCRHTELGSIVALGLATGAVQVASLTSGDVLRDIQLCEHAIVALAWIDEARLLVLACESGVKRGGGGGGGGESGRSYVLLVSLASGESRTIRQPSEPERSTARSLLVSPRSRYFLVQLRDGTIELWDIESVSLIRPISMPNVAAVAWADVNPGFGAGAAVAGATAGEADRALSRGERFVVAQTDGTVIGFAVSGQSVKTLKNVMVGPAVALALPISAAAWSGDCIVRGDAAGTLHVMSLRTVHVDTFETRAGASIAAVSLLGAKGAWRVLVQFERGDFGVWDMQTRECLAASPALVQARGVEWYAERAVVLTLDGSVRVIELAVRGLASSASGSAGVLAAQSVAQSAAASAVLASPFLLGPAHVLAVRTYLQHKCSLGPTACAANASEDEAMRARLDAELGRLEASFVARVRDCASLAERCLCVAEYFGDRVAVTFWVLALHYLHKRRMECSAALSAPSLLSSLPGKPPLQSPLLVFDETPAAAAPSATGTALTSTAVRATTSLIDFSSLASPDYSSTGGADPRDLVPHGAQLAAAQQRSDDDRARLSDENASAARASAAFAVPQYAHLLQERDALRTLELQRARAHEVFRGDVVYAHRAARMQLLLGEHEKAIRLLLDTPCDHASSLVDSLKACLVSAVLSPETFHSTTKLVATNLIANDRLDEGVELLCLIGKTADACRYLQSYGRWREAAWLAKVSLGDAECAAVYRAWALHLESADVRMEAAKVLLSIGDVAGVLQQLYSNKRYEMAALFADACEEWGVPCGAAAAHVLEAVYVEYGTHLFRAQSLGTLAAHYLGKAGAAGRTMLNFLQRGDAAAAAAAASTGAASAAPAPASSASVAAVQTLAGAGFT